MWGLKTCCNNRIRRPHYTIFIAVELDRQAKHYIAVELDRQAKHYIAV